MNTPVTPNTIRALAGRLKRFGLSTPFALLAERLQNDPALLTGAFGMYVREIGRAVATLLDYIDKLEAERNNLYALCASRMDRSELEAALSQQRVRRNERKR